MDAIQIAALKTLLPTLKFIDCMQASRAWYQEFGEHIDHHEFAYALDNLYREGYLRISKPGGFIQYELNS